MLTNPPLIIRPVLRPDSLLVRLTHWSQRNAVTKINGLGCLHRTLGLLYQRLHGRYDFITRLYGLPA